MSAPWERVGLENVTSSWKGCREKHLSFSLQTNSGERATGRSVSGEDHRARRMQSAAGSQLPVWEGHEVENEQCDEFGALKSVLDTPPNGTLLTGKTFPGSSHSDLY